ncbi:hypothetical protein Leryth_010406 [Lithospermum erythrorhizon]|nr:hypothetical protein Leryth_010406 [Lithospermum erythrorhizon]
MWSHSQYGELMAGGSREWFLWSADALNLTLFAFAVQLQDSVNDILLLCGLGVGLGIMRTMGIGLTVIVLCSILGAGRAEVYIVTVEGEPVISYKGGENGFEATAVESDEKIDTTRHYDFEDCIAFQNIRGVIILRNLSEILEHNQIDLQGFTPWCVPCYGIFHSKEKVMHSCIVFFGTFYELTPPIGKNAKHYSDMLLGMLFDHGSYKKLYSYRHLINGFAVHVSPEQSGETCRNRFCGLKGNLYIAKHTIITIDFDSPLDGDGHGSHTAAIAAGNNGIPVRMHGYEFGRASGMAPRARIAVYKALYRLFGGFIADVVAAIEQAVEDGVDILNLSVGPDSPPAATKSTFLLNHRLMLSLLAARSWSFVVQAAGNGGPSPKTVLSYSPWITSVAAAVDDRRYKNHLTIGNGNILPGIGLSPNTHANRTFTMVAANDVLLDASNSKYRNSDCQRPEVFNKKLVAGKILLCGYSFEYVTGTASIKRVWETAKSLHAAGFVLAVENVSPGTKFDPVPLGIPGILITDVKKSMKLIDYYNATTSRDWTGRVKSFKAIGSIGNGLKPILHPSAPEVALFSSRGPNIRDYSFQDADMLKPDILAPGSLIWSAWTPNGTDERNYVGEGFAMVSGTSMAAPHIAGIAALVKQKHPHWSPAAIKSALMTTSSLLDRAGRPIKAQQYSKSETMILVKATPFDYGSGHVNPRAALDPGLVFDAGKHTYCSKSDMLIVLLSSFGSLLHP